MSGLRKRLENYLSTRRSFGYQLTNTGNALHTFVAFMEQNDSDIITTELALSWATLPTSVKPYQWKVRLQHVTGFARYCHAFDGSSEVPPSDLLAYRRQRPCPYFFTDDNIEQLLLSALHKPVRGMIVNRTIYCLLGLLCTTGIRVSEAIRLDLSDVDIDQGILSIRQSKFGKSRHIPLHETTSSILLDYMRTQRSGAANSDKVHLFDNRKGQRVSYESVYRLFVRLTRSLPDQAGRRRPRLHDLRHRFAVKTLLNWYRDGIDVQQQLPVLSTYLGHVEVRDTYWYLSACPELMEAATLRLEKRWEKAREY